MIGRFLFAMLAMLFVSVGFAEDSSQDEVYKLTSSDSHLTGVLLTPVINNAFISGNPNGRVTMIEFFDYNCMPCRILTSKLPSIENKYPDLRIIRVPVGVLTNSLLATKYAMASKIEGDSLDKALLKIKPPVTEDQILKAAKAQGLDIERLKRDINSPQTLNAILANTYAYMSILSEGTSIPMTIVLNSMPPYKAVSIDGSNEILIRKSIAKLIEK